MPDLAARSLEDELETMVARVYKIKGMPPGIDKKVTAFYAKTLWKAVTTGFNNDLVRVDYDTPDHRVLTHLQENVYQFSAAKNYSQLKSLTQALTDSDGKLLPFSKFKKAAFEINEQHVKHWLEAEYNLAVAGGQMAATWARIEESKEALPLLKYVTAGDDRVRQSHLGLHDVIRPVNDAFWNLYYPPNGWNCRCDVQQLASGTITPLDKVSVPDKVPEMFKVNLGKQGLAFPPDHPYYDGLPEAVETQALNMIPNKVATTTQEAEAWAKQNITAKIKSYKGVDINLANQMNETLHYLETQHGIKIDAEIMFEGVTGRAAAHYNWTQNTLNFRKRYKDVAGMFEDSNTRWMKQYGNVYSMVSDFRTVIMHEVGHYVDAKTKRALYDAVQAMDLSIKNEAYSISGYASSDRFRMQLPGAEMVAEVLCAYFSDNPKFLTLPDEVQAAVKTLLK